MANSMESILKSTEDQMNEETTYYYPNMCHICRCYGENVDLKRCSACNMISYCGKEHQKQDWPNHKQFCRVLCEIKKERKVDNLFQSLKVKTEEERKTVFKELEDDGKDGKGDMLINQLLAKATTLMKRKLKFRESHMLQFPRICTICFESRHELLVNCKKCPQITFCKEHLLNNPAHEEQCRKFILNSIFKPMSVMKKAAAVKLCAQIKMEKLPSSMMEFIETFITKNLINSKEEINLLNIAFSEKYSRPLSIIFALEKLDFPKNSESLVVHVVGASLPEQFYIEWEIFLHYFQSVKKLSVILIGDELMFLYNQTEDLCESCKKENKEVIIESHHTVYDEYCRRSNFKKPDIIACLNAGFHAYPTWEKSIKVLNKGQCPLVVTAFTKAEGLRDEQIVKSIFPAANCVFSDYNPYESYYYSRRKIGMPIININQFISIYEQLGAKNTSK
ncbi:putative protein MSS51 homolog, mitochondrial [Leptopilina heterotoma]|uniref:putative protein MSS51 homolog, mitochondrial n=1 Tax=Leptopilina heterotoma TaxID=63436 RepID=UPI001CA87931|nr:putative protein MSS51 homolog, mitochondrial [Leptopilina heterotoma]